LTSPKFPVHVLMEGEPLDNMTVLEADKYLVRSHLGLLVILLVVLVVVLEELVLEDVLVAGLAIKNPPQKTPPQKTPPQKNPKNTKNGFLVFFSIFNFL
jgi:hypothetical protein